MVCDFLTTYLRSMHSSTAHSITKVILHGPLNKIQSVCFLSWGSNPVSQHHKLSPYFWTNVIVAKLNILEHTSACRTVVVGSVNLFFSLQLEYRHTHLQKQIKLPFLCPLSKSESSRSTLSSRQWSVLSRSYFVSSVKIECLALIYMGPCILIIF